MRKRRSRSTRPYFISRNGIDLLRWDASTHRYARHSHEGYALGVVEAGAHAFTARGREWTAVPGRVIVVNPEDVHDGRPARRDAAYSYRMIYVDRGAVEIAVAEAAGRRVPMPFFRQAVVEDDMLAAQLLDAHCAIEREEARLECDARILTTFVTLAQRYGSAPPTLDMRRQEIGAALDYLSEHFADNCSLSELAEIAGVGRFHLLRAFRRHLGMPPHQYQTQLRLREARRLLHAGETAAIAAATVGFADQSHMIRKFKAAYGVTPGRLVQ
jgi:AraC-like DNA-binding protein